MRCVHDLKPWVFRGRWGACWQVGPQNQNNNNNTNNKLTLVATFKQPFTFFVRTPWIALFGIRRIIMCVRAAPCHGGEFSA